MHVTPWMWWTWLWLGWMSGDWVHVHSPDGPPQWKWQGSWGFLQTKLCLPILPDKEPFAECRNMIPTLETADISSSPNCTFESTKIKLSFDLCTSCHFELLSAVINLVFQIVIFWVVTLYNLVYGPQHSGKTFCHVPAADFSKMLVPT